jgi:hypothetical protein
MSAPTVPAQPQTDPTPAPATSPEPTTAPPGPPDPRGATRTFTQAELDAIVTERLARAQRTADAERDRIQREADEARLAEHNELRTLAEQRGARIVELEAQSGQVETLTAERDAALTVVRELVAGELEQAPDYVRDAIAERDPVAQLRYLNQHRDKWSAVNGHRGTPEATRARGNVNLNRDELIAREIEAQRAGRARLH